MKTIKSFIWFMAGNACFEQYSRQLGGWTFQTKRGYFTYRGFFKTIREAYLSR